MTARPERRTWTIDVCRTCGRHATWPFCVHRQEWLDAGVTWPPWCEPVTVIERWPRRRPKEEPSPPSSSPSSQ